MEHKLSCVVDGKEMVFTTGKVAKQSDAAVTVQAGGTVVLVTACGARKRGEDADFLPLTIEYQEKTYAAGKIPGGFFKREGRPTEKEILTARLIDRPIRPLFPEGFFNSIQIVAMVLSSDGQHDPDILAVNGASCALAISSIPFKGPIAAVRVGYIDNHFVANPSYSELENSQLNIVIVGVEDRIIMLEADSKEIDEAKALEAIKFGADKLKTIIETQKEFQKICGKAKMIPDLKLINQDLYNAIKSGYLIKIKEINSLPFKENREDATDLLLDELNEKFIKEENEYTESDIKSALYKIEEENVRSLMLNEHKRVDGRGFEDIREISCEIGALPRTHGSALFTRGQTQSLSVTTLGTSSDVQMIDALEGETSKNFMLHYNFPPFSVGEIKPLRGPGRREIGHGALAEKALKSIMPSTDEFPYTVRVVSDILESNGSSSMATVCASSLSLMDAGVPIKKAVAGIAIGLVKEKDRAQLLTDIAGVEDHYGDMDFKVAGTIDGITAIQMDLKIDGIDFTLLEKAFSFAKNARLKILGIMNSVISAPRKELSNYAPRIIKLSVDPDKVKDIIGPSGRIIKKIISETGVSIDIQDNGEVLVASVDAEKSKQAIDIIKNLTTDPEVGQIFMGTVTKVANFGAFCEITPNREGLVHISEFSDKFVSNINDEVKVGDKFLVKVIGVDAMGKINLSKKQAQSPQESADEGAPQKSPKKYQHKKDR